jgi:hypothetical protein
MPSRPVGSCKLCLRENQELFDSHLMPQGVYKRLRSENEDNPHPVLIDASGSRPSSDQLTDFVFCADCENRFDRLGENYALRMSAYRGHFRLLEELKAVTPTLEMGEFRGYSDVETSFIKRDELAYFALSVFWRASIHTWPSFGGGGQLVRIELGKSNSDALRRYLMQETGPPQNLSLWFVVCNDKVSQGSFNMPNFIGKDNFVWKYGFMACGYLFQLSFAKTMPADAAKVCFLHSPERWIFSRDCHGKTVGWVQSIIDRQPETVRRKRFSELSNDRSGFRNRQTSKALKPLTPRSSEIKAAR